jgi:hypothetical protein
MSAPADCCRVREFYVSPSLLPANAAGFWQGKRGMLRNRGTVIARELLISFSGSESPISNTYQTIFNRENVIDRLLPRATFLANLSQLDER